MNKVDIVLNYLDEIIPNPVCELNYTKDYELLISVMLSAQTTDKRVNEVTKVLFNKYRTLDELSNANIKDVEVIIKSLGSYIKKAKGVVLIAKELINKHNGIVPNDRLSLEALPMVGRKTCNVVLAELFDIPNIAVDTHVERVSKRLGFAKEYDDVLKIEEKLKRKIPKERWCRFHLQMVLFGRYYCKAISPMCNTCKLKEVCKKK